MKELWRDRRAAFGLAVLLGAALVAILAPAVAGDPIAQHDIVATRFLPPLSSDLHGGFHLLGLAWGNWMLRIRR